MLVIFQNELRRHLCGYWRVSIFAFLTHTCTYAEIFADRRGALLGYQDKLSSHTNTPRSVCMCAGMRLCMCKSYAIVAFKFLFLYGVRFDVNVFGEVMFLGFWFLSYM